MQDNLLRKEDTNALNLVVHENPHPKRILETENTNALNLVVHENPHPKRILETENTNALNLVVHENPHPKRILEIENTINTLFGIRLNLSVKKIVSPFIKRSELVKIIDDATKDADTFVKAEIDKVFDEYLSPKKDTLLKNPMPNAKDIWNNVQRDNDIISISNAEAKANDKSLSLEEMINDAFKDAGREKGSSKILRNGPFKNTELQKDN